jgi:glycosyltransferase involved in cell wall biosynthesis
MSDTPTLAIAAGHYTPYRVHLHTRLVRELHGVRVVSLMTKRKTYQWVNQDRPEINTVQLDQGPLEPARGLRKLANELRTARLLWSWLETHRPEAVLVAGYDELPMLAGAQWARSRGRALMIAADSNVHGDVAVGWRKAVKKRFVPWAMRPPAAVMVCGEVGRAFFRRYGVGDERMFVAPYEPDYALIETFPDAEADAVAARLGLAPGRKRLLNCNRLMGVKRVDLVIDAFATMADRRPEWDLIIAGEGPLRAELEARVPAALLASGRVRFVGFVDQRTVTGLYKRCHALVLASEYEPWALVVNEACCAGLPVVATDAVGAAAELVVDGQSGVIVPRKNLAALAGALERVTGPAGAAMGVASAARLAWWRREGDPVAGVRAALVRAGVLTS